MEQDAVMSGKYVRVDDVMELINTSNRGTCDYFIVDQIEELCRSEKIYDLDKVVEQLEEERENVGFVKATTEASAYIRGINDAIKIVKGGGIDGQDG